MENEIEFLSVSNKPLDTGIRRFRMGGGEYLEFNPSDPFLIARIYNGTKRLEEKQSGYQVIAQKFSKGEVTDEVFEFMDTTDSDMRNIINDIFHSELSSAAFDGVGLYAYNSSGVPIWIAFFEAVMSRMEVTVEKAQSEATKKVENLLAKYKR